MWPKLLEIALVPGSSYKKNNFTDCYSNILENVHYSRKSSYTHFWEIIWGNLKSYFTIIILSQAQHW